MHFIIITVEQIVELQELPGFYDNSEIVTNESIINQYSIGCRLLAVEWLTNSITNIINKHKK